MEDPSVMLGVAAICLAMAVTATIVGIPLTLIRRSSLERPLDALFDCFASGLLVLLVGFTMLNWLGALWAALLGLLLVAAIVVTLRRQGFAGLPSFVPRLDPWALVTTVVLGGATLIRLRSVNFLSRGGDAGGYVNWANAYARTGVLRSGFPPLFPMYLGLTSRVFGADDTAAAVPLLGIFLLLATLRLLSQLGVHPVVKVAATLLVGLHTHAVWYSSFPMSEGLQAPLLVILLSNFVAIVRAPRSRLPVGELITLGLVGLGLGLCRVTAPMLLVPMVLLLLATLMPPWRRWSSPIAASAAVFTAGVSVSYLYGITAIRQYYVGNQIGSTVPESIVSSMDDLGLLEVTPQLVALMVVGVAALVALARVAARPGWTGESPEAVEAIDAAAVPEAAGTRPARPAWLDQADRWWWPLPVAVLLVVAGRIVVERSIGNDVNGQLHRFGYPLLILAGASLLVPRALRGPRALAVFFGAIVSMMMVELNVSRFDGPMLHTHFLYWDRYLFSEMFPMVVVIAAVGLSGLVETVVGRWPDRAPGRPSVPALAAMAVPLLFAVVASLTTLQTVRVMNAEETLDGTYELSRDMVRLMPDADLPVLWTSNGPTTPPEFFFPNTWFSLGDPLRETWGRDVVNLPTGSPFTPELHITRSDLTRALACSAEGRAYIVEVDTGGEPVDERLGRDGLRFDDLGSVERVIPHLKQPRDHGWYYSRVRVDVFEVTAAADEPLICPDRAAPT